MEGLSCRWSRAPEGHDALNRRVHPLIHVLPHGFHRIRHYGLLASGTRADNIARARELLAVSNSQAEPTAAAIDPGKPTPCLMSGGSGSGSGHSSVFEAICDVLQRELSAERAIIPGACHSVPRAGAAFNERLEAFLKGA
jgi:hypothetical protein